jgi:hypothetical protein
VKDFVGVFLVVGVLVLTAEGVFVFVLVDQGVMVAEAVWVGDGV